MSTFSSYYAVIFTSVTREDISGYQEMSVEMENLARKQTGFMGFESAKGQIGITVSYWKTLEDIKNWKKNSEHLVAQKMGIKKWYAWYKVRICKVEKTYQFNREELTK